MDGQVGAIRAALDAAGHADAAILAYSAKYASGALRAVPRRRRVRAAVRRPPRRTRWTRRTRVRRSTRSALDVAEGADMVMVKPALAVPRRHRARCATAFDVPVARVPRERRVRDGARRPRRTAGSTATPSRSSTLTAIKRAGADFVLTYFARELAERLCGVTLARTSAALAARSPAASTRRALVRRGGRRAVLRRPRPRARTSFDTDGNRYLDYVQSWGASILGHAHPTVVEAVQRAAADGTSYGAPTAREVELAEAIADACAVGREGAARVVGHRGGDDRGAPRARRDRSGRRS